MTRKKFYVGALVGWIAASQAAGVIGSLFTFQAIPTWYASLVKPEWNPPGWLFGPVWTILYTLMGIAAYRIWRLGAKKKAVRQALVLFSVHLAANSLWSIIFFGWQNIPLALVEIILLLGLIIAVALKFYRLDKLSGYLFVPYLIWVSFATYLTYTIWRLNP